ncbi:Cobalt-precorrin-5A hydrolase [compost metagenome]
MPAFYAGFGCRRECPADALQRLLRQALDNQGLALADLRGIASISLKADEPGLQQLAERLGLPLVLYHGAQLQPYEPLLSHRSAAAHQHSGCWGVAESAALALASQRQGTARLLLTRQVLGSATLALAC